MAALTLGNACHLGSASALNSPKSLKCRLQCQEVVDGMKKN